MTDKAKIRAEIEKRYRENKADGYSDVCEELWDILSFIDSMQEEPISEPVDFEKELYKAFGQVKDFTLGVRIAKRFYDMGKNSQEPVSEDLEEAGKEWLSPQLDKSYAAYGETKQMELTHFDGYAMLDAIEFGAKWQKAKDSIPAEYLEKAAESYAFTMSGEDEVLKYNAFIDGAKWQKQQDQSTIELAEEHAMLAGMEKMKEEMTTKAADATIGLPYENKDGGYTHLIDVSRPLPVGNNKIAIIFKED